MALNNPFDETDALTPPVAEVSINPFDVIATAESREESPFGVLPKGISPEAPEDINPFDAIGYEAPPEPSYQKVADYRGAEILQDEGGKWYSKSEQGIVELPEEVKGQVQSELGGLEEPWIDPITVGGGAAGVGGRLAYRAGARGLELLGRTALSGGIAAGAEYPLGIVTEAVGEEHPELAPYVNIGLGILSGVTIENIIEKAIIGKGLTPTARAVNKYITELRAGVISDDVATKVASDITEEVKVRQPDIVTPKEAEISGPDISKDEGFWKTTRAEFLESKGLAKEADPYARGLEVQEHKFDVERALMRGEDIPSKVLRDFPDMTVAKEALARKAPEEEVNAFDAITRELEGEVVPPKIVEEAPIPTRPVETAEEVGEVGPGFVRTPGDVQAGSLAFGMPLPKQAASVNLERVGADYSTKKMILDVSDQYKGQIDEARRGKITHKTTRELADDLGMTEKQLLRRRKGRAFNAEEALAARDILNTSAGNLVDLQKRIVANPTEENLALFKMAMEKHAAVQAEVSGVATEAGRALSAHRIQSAKNARVAKNYQKMLDVLGGRNNSEKLARYFSTIDPTDQTAVNKFIMEMTEAKTSDKVFEAWINGLLSGPQTHVVNTTSNALTFLSGIPERATGATLDLMRATATGTPRERMFGEIPEHIYGAWHGMKEGVRAGMKAFATEIPTEDAMKLEIPRKMAIKGKKGRIIRLPGRSLMAMDEFFKAVNYRAELHSLAFRQAAKEGLKGQERAVRIAEIVAKPSDELKEKATEEMLYRVFQKELGPSGKALTKLRTVTPGLKYVVPFLKTPTNIAKFGIERTPLSLARYPGMFRKLMKGELKGVDITDEMAKTLMGSMIGLGTFMYAKEGNITGGGPKNKSDREALYRTGWQPYSVKVGNKYYSYGRLEPLGMVMGISADASDIWDEMNKEEQENVAALIALSVTKNLTSKTFMKGLADAMNATTDPARYGEKWVQGFIASGVPSISAATTRAIDPELKEAQTIIDKIKSRIPGLSGELFAKRDIWGQAIERDLAGVSAMVSPVYIAEGKGTKADQEVVRLGVRIGKPSRKVRDQELTPEQYDKLVIEAGAEAKKRVDKFVGQKAYDGMKDEFKAKMIKRQYDGAVGFVRRKLWNEIRQKGE